MTDDLYSFFFHFFFFCLKKKIGLIHSDSFVLSSFLPSMVSFRHWTTVALCNLSHHISSVWASCLTSHSSGGLAITAETAKYGKEVVLQRALLHLVFHRLFFGNYKSAPIECYLFEHLLKHWLKWSKTSTIRSLF